MAEYVPVLRTPELGPGEIREVEVRGQPVVLSNIGQTYYAVSAVCPHDGVNLAREGRREGDLLVCPRDGRAYDLRTGEQVRPSRWPALERYAIRVEDNVIKVGPPLPEWRKGAA